MTPEQKAALQRAALARVQSLSEPEAAPVAKKPSTLENVLGIAASGADGLRQGVSMIAGAPVDLINNAPRLANLIPGVDDVGPITDQPFGGGAMIDEILRLGGTIEDFEPQTATQRVVNRVGEEIGATAVPVAGTIARASNIPLRTVNQMAAAPKNAGQSVAAQFLQPAAVNPVGLAGREAAFATAAGTGAGISNELAGEGSGAGSDFLGSLLGVLGLATGSKIIDGGKTLVAGATGNAGLADDVAKQEVADRIINNSTDLGEQAAQLKDAGRDPRSLDTQDLVDVLRRPAPVEDAIPGFNANVGDRTGDPRLATFAFNQDAVSPGAANARRVGNETTINDRFQDFTPDGDTGRLRTDLQTGVDNTIGQAVSDEDLARAIFGDASQAVQPSLPTAEARGSNIRAGLTDAKDAVIDRVRELYAPINDADTPVDIGPLREQFGQIDDALPLNDSKRFRPAEAAIPDQLAPATPDAPIPTGVLDANGQPITRAPDPVDTSVPLKEVTSLRSGLTDDIRGQNATGQRQAARVGSQFRDAVDDFTEQAIPPELKGQLDEARAARKDQGDRFERPGTGVAETLKPREGGGFQMDDSAVPSRFAQPDSGRLSDLRALLSEAGSDPRVRTGLADEVLADVQSRGLIDKPEQLTKYLDERNVLLTEFPELRTALDDAGAARTALTDAENTTKDTTRRLTTPGRSAEASFLKHVEDPAAAIRTVTTSPDPRKAVQDLIATAGADTAKTDLRTALWEEVKRSGKMDAPGMTGETRWNGKKLTRMFDDPKFAAVAEELWADDPEDLAAIKEVFEALASADGSMRARAAGSSGTAQSLTGKFDPSLTTSSIASRARSVNRGQLSLPIAVVDILGTWLRGKSAKVQARAIDNLASEAVNNPGLAADLLEVYNPATRKAYRAMITQKYGVRGTQLINMLDRAENEDEVVEAVKGDQ